jgi:hypothetical protein
MSLENELRREKGYIRVLEGALSERKFWKPYIIIDNSGIIRFASPNFEASFLWKPENVVGKTYGEFISNDLYETALRELAYRMNVLRNLNKPGDSQKPLEGLAKDYDSIRHSLSRDAKIAHIGRLVRAFEHRHTDDVQKIDSDVRIKLGNEKAVTIKDTLWLVKYKSSHGGEYAGSLVELDPSSLSTWSKVTRWMGSWFDLKHYNITNEYVITFESFEPKALEVYASELIADRHRKSSSPLVLDFREIGNPNKKVVEGTMLIIKDLAFDCKLIIGNATKDLRTMCEERIAVIAKENKRKSPALRFHKLIYPTVREPSISGAEEFIELKTYQEHEDYIKKGLTELGYANIIPEKSVREVQPGSEGKSNDIQSASPGAQ